MKPWDNTRLVSAFLHRASVPTGIRVRVVSNCTNEPDTSEPERTGQNVWSLRCDDRAGVCLSWWSGNEFLEQTQTLHSPPTLSAALHWANNTQYHAVAHTPRYDFIESIGLVLFPTNSWFFVCFLYFKGTYDNKKVKFLDNQIIIHDFIHKNRAVIHHRTPQQEGNVSFLLSNQIWAHWVAATLSHKVTLWNMATAVKDEKAMCWIVALSLLVCVWIFSLPAATSAWWLGPKSASFQLIGHNLPLHFQLPGKPLKLELLFIYRTQKETGSKGSGICSHQNKLYILPLTDLTNVKSKWGRQDWQFDSSLKRCCA